MPLPSTMALEPKREVLVVIIIPIPAACGNDFQSRTGYLRGACQHQPLDGVPPRGCGSGTDRCTIHTLTLAAAGTQWDSAQWATQGAWDFGGTGPNSPPKLKYNDYDGSGGINLSSPYLQHRV